MGNNHTVNEKAWCPEDERAIKATLHHAARCVNRISQRGLDNLVDELIDWLEERRYRKNITVEAKDEKTNHG